MADTLNGARVAIIATDGVEQVELTQPREAVEQAGARADIVSVSEGRFQAMNHDLEPADSFTVDRTIDQVSVDDYDALILPAAP
jgi:protease I